MSAFTLIVLAAMAGYCGSRVALDEHKPRDDRRHSPVYGHSEPPLAFRLAFYGPPIVTLFAGAFFGWPGMLLALAAWVALWVGIFVVAGLVALVRQAWASGMNTLRQRRGTPPPLAASPVVEAPSAPLPPAQAAPAATLLAAPTGVQGYRGSLRRPV